ncbi:tail fiber protein / tail tubular protein A [Enterobacter phage 02_vB_Eclo_IJM]|nr:tail fiber protein / tail tubular protein A [Enterobacter phage 02_vB_Eclo_IJM]
MHDSNTKTWKETVEPGTVIGFDNQSMPHALVRQADGSFDFKEMEWSGRGAVTMTPTRCRALWTQPSTMCSSTVTVLASCLVRTSSCPALLDTLRSS